MIFLSFNAHLLLDFSNRISFAAILLMAYFLFAVASLKAFDVTFSKSPFEVNCF